MCGDRLCTRLLGRADDGGVACAAAQVSSKSRVMIGVFIQMCSGHAHHETGRAKATLAAVLFYHGLLHRVQRAIGCGKTFDGCDVFALKLWQEQYAGGGYYYRVIQQFQSKSYFGE